MQANEQTNFDRQNGKKDDLEDKSNMTANNFNQNRTEETQEIDTLGNSAHSDSNQANFDQQKTNKKIPNPTKAIDIRKFYFESTTNAIVKPRS